MFKAFILLILFGSPVESVRETLYIYTETYIYIHTQTHTYIYSLVCVTGKVNHSVQCNSCPRSAFIIILIYLHVVM